MHYDFNKLENKAESFLALRQPSEALKIYYFMADGDTSLDGGYLGKKIAQCYEEIGQLHAARYWYGRAFEENPDIRVDCLQAHKRLESIINMDLDLIIGSNC